MPCVKRPIISIASAMSSSDLSRSLKGKHGLARCPLANAVFQGLGRGKIHGDAEQIAESDFPAEHGPAKKTRNRCRIPP